MLVLKCCANQLTGFFMRATLALNGLNIIPFSILFFSYQIIRALLLTQFLSGHVISATETLDQCLLKRLNFPSNSHFFRASPYLVKDQSPALSVHPRYSPPSLFTPFALLRALKI